MPGFSTVVQTMSLSPRNDEKMIIRATDGKGRAQSYGPEQVCPGCVRRTSVLRRLTVPPAVPSTWRRMQYKRSEWSITPATTPITRQSPLGGELCVH